MQSEEDIKQIKIRHSKGEITTEQSNQLQQETFDKIVQTNKKMAKWYVGKTDDLLIISINPNWADNGGLHQASAMEDMDNGLRSLTTENPRGGLCCCST